MQRDEKLAILDTIFAPIPKDGITEWGLTPTSRWYVCNSHHTAKHLATFLLSQMQMRGILSTTCPHRYDPPETGAKLIVESMDDARPIA